VYFFFISVSEYKGTEQIKFSQYPIYGIFI